MPARKPMLIVFGIFILLIWILGPAIQAEAETLNYKGYTYSVKMEYVPIGDVENHVLTLETRRGFYIFENGDVATVLLYISGDYVKGVGSNISYQTITFPDGSTILTKRQMTLTPAGGASAAGTVQGEIIKGTGRFERIKGTVASKSKWLPLEKGESGPKGISEATITYTLPPK
jgi:hypothetical protein